MSLEGKSSEGEFRILDAKVAPGDPDFVKDGGVYDLGTGTRVHLGKAKASDLKVAAIQKGPGHPAAYGGQGVLSVALDLDPTAAPGQVPLGREALALGQQAPQIIRLRLCTAKQYSIQMIYCSNIHDRYRHILQNGCQLPSDLRGRQQHLITGGKRCNQLRQQVSQRFCNTSHHTTRRKT